MLSQPICIDSGASMTVSNNKDDFVSLQPIKDQRLSGIAKGLPIAGIGTIKWPLLTDASVEVKLYICQSLSVPQCPMNLLSPQYLAQQAKCANDNNIHVPAGWSGSFQLPVQWELPIVAS
jgi:hypothetical protein